MGTLLADFGGPCLGSADRLLGNLASVVQRWQAAQAHFEAALEIDQRTGSRVWLAHSRTAYAATAVQALAGRRPRTGARAAHRRAR